jgi:hypothetical protein
VVRLRGGGFYRAARPGRCELNDPLPFADLGVVVTLKPS